MMRRTKGNRIGLACALAAMPALIAPQAIPAAAAQTQEAGTPLEWTNLSAMVGRYPGNYSKEAIDLFDKGSIAAALRTMLGAKADVLETNLSVTGPLERHGNIYYISGNAPHKGGEEQAYVLIDAVKRVIQVGIWEKGKLTVYAPAGGRLPEPPEIRTVLANSPGEDAVPLPGTPWELLPIQGRPPAAYVEAAASPNVTSVSLYCENGRPYMAMLTKPMADARLTITWNFAGRIVNIPVQRAKGDGTYWVGPVAGTPLLQHLMTQKDYVELRINARHAGSASLANAAAVLRRSLPSCARL